MSLEAEKTAAKAGNADAENCYRRFLAGDNNGLDDLVTLYGESLTLFVFSFICDMTEAKMIMMDAFAQLVISAGSSGEARQLKHIFIRLGATSLCDIAKNRNGGKSMSRLAMIVRRRTALRTIAWRIL